MNSFHYAQRSLQREIWQPAQAGKGRKLSLGSHWLLLLFAVATAMAATSAVALFTDRVSRAMLAQGGEAIAADLQLLLRAPTSSARLDSISAAGLESTRVTTFPTVALSAEESALVGVKAVDPSYPLRGAVTIETAAGEKTIQAAPAAGEVWIEPRALTSLGIAIGDKIDIGYASFTVSAALLVEPDREVAFVNLAPRLLMQQADLAKTKLLGPGSRASYRLLLAGDTAAIDQYRADNEPTLTAGESFQSAAEARPALRTALDRADVFLNLAALVSVILAAIAIALSAQQQARRRYDEIALLKSLGASLGFIRLSLMWQLLLVAGAGLALGSLLGWVAQTALAEIIGSSMQLSLPSAQTSALLPALATAAFVLVGFAWPPLMRACDAPPAKVFQRSLPGPSAESAGLWLIGLGCILLLIIWQAGTIATGLLVAIGMAIAVLLLWLLSQLLQKILALLLPLFAAGSASKSQWRQGVLLGLNATLRGGAKTSLLIVTFGSGLTVLFLLAIVRGDMLASWQNSIADDAPNRFLVNISPEQTQPLAGYFAESGRTVPVLYPMVRARMIGVKGQAVAASDFDEAETAALFRREMNLSWQEQLREDNQLLEGQWWTAQDSNKPLVSIEQSIARRLDLKIGDSLRFDTAGQQFSVTVHSIRKVNWDSMQANFYLLFPPQFLERFPWTAISAFRLEAESNQDFTSGLVRQFPNISVLNIEVVLTQLRGIADRVSQAIELVFYFTLLAGVLVLFAAIASNRNERQREAAVMRALGAHSRVIKQALLSEFVLLGLLAAGTATLIAQILAVLVAVVVLELPYSLSIGLWVFAISAAVFGIAAAGVWSLRSVVSQPAIDSLREFDD